VEVGAGMDTDMGAKAPRRGDEVDKDHYEGESDESEPQRIPYC
jgi:hypothetical protein